MVCRFISLFWDWVLSNSNIEMEIEKLDIDSMFVKYTINEIRDIEEQIKIDMEKKKEELRSMVG